MPDIKFNIRCNIPAAATNGVLAGFEERTNPGAGPPLHTHRDQTEIFHIIHGRFLFALGDQRIEATTGDTVVVPPGAAHAYKNIGDTEGVLHFEMVPPGNTEEFFERLVNEFNAIEDHAAFFDAYGMDLNGPPLD